MYLGVVLSIGSEPDNQFSLLGNPFERDDPFYVPWQGPGWQKVFRGFWFGIWDVVVYLGEWSPRITMSEPLSQCPKHLPLFQNYGVYVQCLDPDVKQLF